MQKSKSWAHCQFKNVPFEIKNSRFEQEGPTKIIHVVYADRHLAAQNNHNKSFGKKRQQVCDRTEML